MLSSTARSDSDSNAVSTAIGNGVTLLDETFPSLPQHFYQIGVGSKGRGLFATASIPPGTLLHVAPCILVVEDEYNQHMRHTILEHYLFNCGKDKLLALGHGSLFNHSRRPNVDYRVDGEQQCIRYISGHRIIEPGEELCIFYGANLWFDDAEEGDGNDSSSNSEEEAAEFLGRLQL